MPKSVKLLLTENVEALGIVGDVVTVRTGYARNFLLPRSYATTPTEDAIKAVAKKREEAQRELAELRKQREDLIKKLEGIEITLQRSCNDLGHLYASVTQQEIATALEAAGHKGVRPRDVRLNQNIKRIDTYEVPIKFDSDLDATIKLWVVADRKLDFDKIEQAETAPTPEGAAAPAEAPAAEGAAPAAPEKAPKGRKGDAEARPEKKAEGKAGAPEGAPAAPKAKGEGKPKGEKARGDKPKADAAPAAPDKSGWGKKVETPDLAGMFKARRPRRERE
jgi:large subunit ribosomal protein L9